MTGQAKSPNRWLDWTPVAPKFCICASEEPTKPPKPDDVAPPAAPASPDFCLTPYEAPPKLTKPDALQSYASTLKPNRQNRQNPARSVGIVAASWAEWQAAMVNRLFLEL